MFVERGRDHSIRADAVVCIAYVYRNNKGREKRGKPDWGITGDSMRLRGWTQILALVCRKALGKR
jgi:hypothetical protein